MKRSSDTLGSKPEPNYDATLDFEYQDFTSYLFLGNRVDNFTAYFNTFFESNKLYNEAYDEYRASLISIYNRRLDSLGILPVVSSSVKDKLDKAIERSSKIIQFNKNSKFIDDAVLIIGKSYYLLTDYYKAERTFNEFLSKFSSSVLADEAILYLGRTKVRLDKIDESEKIFKNLIRNSTDNEIKSLAARDLGIISYNKHKYEDAAAYFKASIDFSKDDERKAEGEFILAKILSDYKPELAATEYKKVLNFSSDYDLAFFARLNYAKGLLYNKDFKNLDEELTSLRKKYRDDPAFTQLIDLEIANGLYAQNKIQDAKNKYYEVIVKYPGTPSSADAYYHLAKHEEDVNNDYLSALVNFKKSMEENSSSDYNKESRDKAATLERYFSLLGSVKNDTTAVEIPTANADVEKYRKIYNEEKGLEQQQNEHRQGMENNTGDDGRQTGDGKGKPGGKPGAEGRIHADSMKNGDDKSSAPKDNSAGPNNNVKGQNKGNTPGNHGDVTEPKDSVQSNLNLDSLKGVRDSLSKIESEEKVFNAYFELAELFMFNLGKADSAEYYLNFLLNKFQESSKQEKVLYALGSFYKNAGEKIKSDETFNKIIANYPNSIYAYEAKKMMGINATAIDYVQNPAESIFKTALDFFNQKKYAESITLLQSVETKYPGDSLVAKALYTIGWIYENELSNKDSSIFYYKQLKEKFPQSTYTMQVTPLLDYMASIEPQDSTRKSPIVTDSLNNNINDSLNANQEIKSPPDEEAKKEKENSGDVQVDTTSANQENRLTPEEIERLLKEGEQTDPGK